MENKNTELEKELLETKEKLAYEMKWKGINKWTTLIGTMILFLILCYALYLKLN